MRRGDLNHLVWYIVAYQIMAKEAVESVRSSIRKKTRNWPRVFRLDLTGRPFKEQLVMMNLAKVTSHINQKLKHGKEITPEDLGEFRWNAGRQLTNKEFKDLMNG